jgi:hypothetical protein
VVIAVLLVGAATTLTVHGRHQAASTSPGEARAGLPPLTFGVLGSRCEANRAAALHRSGVRFAELGVDWSQWEPRPGSFDVAYEQAVRRAVQSCQKAGLGVILTPGLHTAPAWVAELTAGYYVDQNGDRDSARVPNLVFSAAVRKAVGDYLAELDHVLGLGSLAAIRVGTGTNGELGYPHTETPTKNPYWAFDDAAQTGHGLADGATVTPLPSWRPGLATWQGQAVSTDQVRQWFSWYSTSVADAEVWVIRQLRQLGYTGPVHLPLAGRGALPDDLSAAIAARLDGSADRDGSLESGLSYPDQLPQIAQLLAATERPGWGAVYADSSSVDDATAGFARQLTPPQDRCLPGDAGIDLVHDPAVQNWPSFRWTVANARRAGLHVVGENPGPPDAPGTGSNDQTDSWEQQMVYAPRYAQECGMDMFQWAFEDTLFSHGHVGLDMYAQRIEALSEGRRRRRNESAVKRAAR